MNLNKYRNTHFRELAQWKKSFAEEVMPLIPSVKLDKIELIYTIYFDSKRLTDLSNWCSVIGKFAEDCLVSKKVILDDNYHYIKKITYHYGGIIPRNGYCKLEIKEVK